MVTEHLRVRKEIGIAIIRYGLGARLRHTTSSYPYNKGRVSSRSAGATE